MLWLYEFIWACLTCILTDKKHRVFPSKFQALVSIHFRVVLKNKQTSYVIFSMWNTHVEGLKVLFCTSKGPIFLFPKEVGGNIKAKVNIQLNIFFFCPETSFSGNDEKIQSLGGGRKVALDCGICCWSIRRFLEGAELSNKKVSVSITGKNLYKICWRMGGLQANC